jgi:hypothetical protein
LARVKAKVTLPPAVAFPEESVKEPWALRSPEAIKITMNENEEDFCTE